MKLILIFLLTTTMWAKEATMSNKELVLGGGCFWCLEAVFEEIPGVKNVVSGYMGGDESSANYVAVSTGQTEHAEVVRISFDPNITNMEKLLNVFWMIHDPTTLNRQGADVGPQYRSIIFVNSQEQMEIAQNSLSSAQKNLSKPIVTQIVPVVKFYMAEEYHQNYYKNNPNQGYCQVVIAPKIKKLRSLL